MRTDTRPAGGRGDASLHFRERLAIGLGRAANETAVGKLLQDAYLRQVSYRWMRAALARHMLVDGLDRIAALQPDRGVLFAVNHRSFFDQYALVVAVWSGPAPWARRVYFPVRANFFFERLSGIFVNFFMSAGAMYPPVFRQLERSALNKDALECVVRFLRQPGTLVGFHPEGTRNKGGDAYDLLPAQPGIGQVALRARPLVIPVFINGLTNRIASEIRANFQPRIRQQAPCICVFGEPVAYSDLQAQTPRPALYKKAADRIRTAILQTSEREREIRRMCRDGLVADDDRRWLANRLAHLHARPLA